MALFLPARKLVESGWAPTGLLAPLTPNAQLRGAALGAEGPASVGARLGLQLASRQPEGGPWRLDPCDRRNAHIARPRDLRNADLRESDLRGADLRCVAMRGADLRHASIERADLRWAALHRADLSSATLDAARLTHARLDDADLFGARMRGADLSRSHLRRAMLRQASMEDAILNRARLERAAMDRARIDGADLRSARLQGASLHSATLTGADLEGARLDGAGLYGARLDGAAIRFASVVSATLLRARLDGAALQSVDLGKILHPESLSLSEAFGDGSVVMPYKARIDGRFPRHRPRATAHWPRETLSDSAFLSRWRGWREAEGMTWPPPGRALAHLAGVEPTPAGRPVAPGEIAR
ncbi:MAG: pentapeptide repeat-containing protein [Paracoccaceae bacterium]